MFIIRQKTFGILESLAGRKKFYHGTPEENVQDILENGLSSEKVDQKRLAILSKIEDPERRCEIAKRMGVGLVYISDSKKYADHFGDNNEKTQLRNNGAKGKTLEIYLPHDDVPKINWQINPNDYKSARDLYNYDKKIDGKRMDEETRRMVAFKFGDNANHRRAIGGTLGPEYFKDSPHYKRPSFKEIKEYQLRRFKNKT